MDTKTHVPSFNINYRHLTDQQRATIAAELANIGHGGHRIKSPLGDLLYTAVSQAEAAKLMNVAKRSVERAIFIYQPSSNYGLYRPLY
jgi:hypothetical protein